MSSIAFGYTLYGLTICSEVEFSDLPAMHAHVCPDVVISFGSVPDSLLQATASGPIWQTDGKVFLLKVPGVAGYLVKNGNAVIVDPQPGVEMSDVGVYLWGTVMGVVLHQRGILSLHASSIEVNGRAVAFAGVSGVGKSTLVAHLNRRGYRVLSDDLTVVTFDDQQQPQVRQGIPRIKLWADALEHIEHVPEELVRDHSGLEKYKIMLRNALQVEPLPFAEIYFLGENMIDESIIFEHVTGVPAVFMLGENSYRPRMLKGMGRKTENFRQCTLVLNGAKAVKLTRPKTIGMMDGLIDALESRWERLA